MPETIVNNGEKKRFGLATTSRLVKNGMCGRYQPPASTFLGILERRASKNASCARCKHLCTCKISDRRTVCEGTAQADIWPLPEQIIMLNLLSNLPPQMLIKHRKGRLDIAPIFY